VNLGPFEQLMMCTMTSPDADFEDRVTAAAAAGYTGIAVGVAFGAGAFWFLSNENIGEGIFMGYIAMILITTGRSMEQRIALRDQMVKGRVADAMRPSPPAVPATMSLAEALDHSLRGTNQRFPVTDEGRVIGTVSMESARRVGARDPMRPVRDALIPLNQTIVIDPNETLDNAFEWLSGEDGLVLKDGVLVGALSPRDVEHWYRRVIQGQATPTGFAALPPRPDI
jgi:CBS domain.